MKNKKLTTIVLTTAFAIGCTAPVFADVPAINAVPLPIDATEEQQAINMLAVTVGTVEEINETSKYNSILVKNDQTEIEFYVNENKTDGNATWVIDENGLPIALKDLKGKEVVVSHSQAMTMSIPAKCNATAVMVKGEVSPNYAVIEKVSKNADGSVTLTTDNGSRLVTVDKDASLSPYLTKNMIYLDMLKEGDEVVLYYDIMALSYPAQAYTDKVLLLRPSAMEQLPETESKPEVPVSSEMVNLREATAELGMDIHWNEDGNTVIVNKGAFSATITIGSEQYGINRMLLMLDQAAEIRDGRTYVPKVFIDELKSRLN